MSVSAAAPAMCLGGSFGTFMQGAGTAVSLAFLLATIVIVMVGWNYGQLSSRYNSAGGTYSCVRSVLGARAGFVSGWIYMGVNVCTGVIGAIFATYLHELIPAIPIWLGVLILLVPIFFVGWNGVEMTSKALIVVWAIQMVLILYPAIKDRWKENSPSSILSNKVIPVIASVILLYMIFSSSPVYIAATAVWTLVAWLASFLWKGAASR